MAFTEYAPIEDLLLNYLEELKEYYDIETGLPKAS